MDSVSQHLQNLKGEDRERAALEICDRYFQQIVKMAKKKLIGIPSARVDEQEIANSAFRTFFRRAQEGKFPRLDDRYDLWNLLVHIANHKAIDAVRRHRTQKRDVNREQAMATNDSSVPQWFHTLESEEPTPQQAAILAEAVQTRLAQLDNERMRKVALLKMGGHTNLEIAEELNVSRATVERILKRIRLRWS